jgi:predicted ATPase
MSTIRRVYERRPLRRGVAMGSTSAILGRDLELGVVSGFLGRVETGPNALVIEGPAGIGKTTIWRAAVDDASNRGYRVLISRGAESEARLSYAALGDILGDVPDTLLNGMPAPLRQALDAALLRAEIPGRSLDQRAVSLAAAHALRSLTADSPVVIAVDDLQWLDRPSARVLSFALRRLLRERIGVLVTVRQDAGSNGDPVAIDRAIARTTHLPVGPLPPEPLGRILRDRASGSIEIVTAGVME